MARFIIYSYQFSPISNVQDALFDSKIVSVEERMENKQDYLTDYLSNEASIMLKHRNKQFKHKTIFCDSGVFVFKIANQKITSYEDNFSKKSLNTSPSCFIIIDNRKDIQRIYIEHKSTSFSEPKYVASILHSSLNKYLNRFGLKIDIQKEYQVSEFWDLVKKHTNSITMVRFHLSYPNLPRVWSGIQELIKQTSIDTNSHQTMLQYKSDDNGCLELNEQNEEISSLALASANSGSEIVFKIRNFKAYKKTGNTEKSIEIEEVEMMLQPDLIENPLEKIISILNKVN